MLYLTRAFQKHAADLSWLKFLIRLYDRKKFVQFTGNFCADFFKGSSCSEAVECTARQPEVMGSNPAESLSIYSVVRPLAGGATIQILIKRNGFLEINKFKILTLALQFFVSYIIQNSQIFEQIVEERKKYTRAVNPRLQTPYIMLYHSSLHHCHAS